MYFFQFSKNFQEIAKNGGAEFVSWILSVPIFSFAISLNPPFVSTPQAGTEA
jgi:hypothetical protein